MHKATFVFIVASALASPAVGAGPSEPAVASSTATLLEQTLTPPPPANVTAAAVGGGGVTTRPGQDVFITLTRSAYPASDLPTNADIVTPEMLQKFDAQNAGEAIARQTSVQTLPIGTLGSALTASIRGSTSEQTTLMIDGRPVGGVSLSGSQDLSEVPIENIDHIEILRGGISALYGPNAMGGAINIITKRATYAGRPISHLTIESRSYGTQVYRLNAASRTGPFDYFFYGNRQWESGFRDNSDASTYNVGGNAGFSMGAAGKFLFDASSYHANFGVPGLACGSGDPLCLSGVVLVPNRFNDKDEKLASSPSARQVTDTNYLRTSYLLPLPADGLMTLRLFGSQREVDFNDSTDPVFPASSDRHEQSKGGEAQFNLPLGFMIGGNFVRDREDNTDRLTLSKSFIHAIENWGIFAQDQFHWKGLTLIPSGRYDHNSQAGESKNPRVQLVADAAPWLRFSGSAARSFKAPTIDELFFNDPAQFLGNPLLRPETAWTYDAGFELHQDSISFRATYFRANISNLIQNASTDPSNPLAPFGAINVGSARRQGAEIQIQHAVNDYFKDAWNYTYLRNVGIPPGFDHLVDLEFSPRHTVNWLGTITPTKRWTIDSTLRYLDSRFSGNDHAGAKLGSQLILDLRVSYQLRQLQLYIGADDLTNKRYEEQPGFPLPGRAFYGGGALRMWG